MKSFSLPCRPIVLVLIILIVSFQTTLGQSYNCTTNTNFASTNTGGSISYTFTPSAGKIIQIQNLNNGFNVAANYSGFVNDYINIVNNGVTSQYNNNNTPPALITSNATDGTLTGSFTDGDLFGTNSPAPVFSSTVACICDPAPVAPVISGGGTINPGTTPAVNTTTPATIDGYGSTTLNTAYQYRYNAGAWVSGFPSNPLSLGTLDIQAKQSRNDSGCESGWSNTVSFTVICPTITATVSGQTNPKCNTGSDGTIPITASGGTPPYSFSVDNGLTYPHTASTSPYTYTWSGLPAGVYKIRVRDTNGCESPAIP